MDEFKPVTEDELQAFLRAYPRPLSRDVFAAGEPPLISWNDFLLAPQWPESMVAKRMAGTSGGFVHEAFLKLARPESRALNPQDGKDSGQ